VLLAQPPYTRAAVATALSRRAVVTLRERIRGSKALPVALVVLAVYAGWIGTYLAAGNDVRDFIGIGRTFLDKGNFIQAVQHPGAPQIHVGGYRPLHSTGYDGQFSYYIAVTPRYARAYMDDPSYRYSRVLHAGLARLLGLGDEDALPYTLLLLNWLAAGLGTFCLAAWMQARGVSRWYALLYGLSPGILVGVQRDVTEPVAYALVALGVLLLDTGRRSRPVAAGVAFGLAAFARQTTLLFPLGFALWLAIGAWGSKGSVNPKRRWREALILLALSLGPYVAYGVFLRVWLGSVSSGNNLSPIPLGGLVHPPWELDHQGATLVFVVVPALIALIALVPRGPLRSPSWLPWFLLLANFLATVVFFGRLYEASFTSVVRIATGIMLAALLCLPYVDQLSDRRRAWLVAAAAVAVGLAFPLFAVQGFVSLMEGGF
jgi:hypothetical protein